MPTFEFQAPDGKTYEVGAPEGATQQQAFEMLQQQLASGGAPAAGAPSGTFSAGQTINDVGRQLGLTARYAMTGPAEALQTFTEPLRQLVTDPTRRLMGDNSPSEPLGSLADRIADKIGLPRPETPLERTVGSATRLGFGAATLGGGAKAGADLMAGPTRAAIAEVAPTTATAPETLLRGLSARPGQQIAGAAGAGAAGQASREAGGSPTQQTIASVIGGLTGAAAAGGLGTRELIDAGMRRFSRPAAQTPQQLDTQISLMLQGQNVDYAALSAAAKASLRQEVQQALNTGGTIDPAALARLADFRGVGATPFRSMLTQRPGDVTREQNLAKIAANAGDDTLPNTINANNQALIARLDDLGASRRVQPVEAGQAVQGAIIGRRDDLRRAEQAAWDALKDSPAYKQPLYPDALNKIVASLDEERLLHKLDPEVSRMMRAYQTGEQPFTPQDMKALQNLLADGKSSTDGSTRRASGIASRILANEPAVPITNPRGVDLGNAPITGRAADALRGRDAQAQQSVNLLNEARGATRRAYEYEDSNRLVRSALHDDADPTRLAQSYIIGGTVDEARAIAREVGPNTGAVRDSLIAWIKAKAMGDGETRQQIGTVNSKGLENALAKIGDEKLRVFFTADELADLKRIGRVATLMQNQPAGSAVNNSNTASAIIGKALDNMSRKLSLMPGGPLINMGLTQPLQNATVSYMQRQATSAPKALIAPPQMPPAARPLPLLLPGLAAGGSLLAPPQ